MGFVISPEKNNSPRGLQCQGWRSRTPECQCFLTSTSPRRPALGTEESSGSTDDRSVFDEESTTEHLSWRFQQGTTGRRPGGSKKGLGEEASRCQAERDRFRRRQSNFFLNFADDLSCWSRFPFIHKNCINMIFPARSDGFHEIEGRRLGGKSQIFGSRSYHNFRCVRYGGD